jgi:hypothetical protein
MKRFITTTLALLFCSLILPFSMASAFSPFGQACTSGGGSSAVCTDSKTGASGTDPVEADIADATHIVAIGAGVIAIVIMLVGAIRYMTSGGDANAVSSAKNTILYAVIGLAVVVLAQSIIVYVVDRI